METNRRLHLLLELREELEGITHATEKLLRLARTSLQLPETDPSRTTREGGVSYMRYCPAED